MLHCNNIAYTLFEHSPQEQTVSEGTEIQYGSGVRWGAVQYVLGQGAAQQGMALLSPCHCLVPLGVESASACMCVSEAVMRVGAQPNGHLTGTVALS